MKKNLFEKVEKILSCPRTGGALNLDENKQKLITNDKTIEYNINDDIIDFIPEESRKNIDSYAKRAKRYEKIFKKPGLFIRLFDKFVWGITHNDYAPQVIDFIPKGFNGILLDIPVGTGVFTYEKYKNLPDATIIVGDYSINMLKFAKEKFTTNKITNIIYLHTDVGNLPLIDQSVDLILSMNGFHAFPDKDKALQEIARILRTGGQFSGCFYVKGAKRSTDKVVKSYYSRKGWFKPPYYTVDEITQKFDQNFKIITHYNKKAMFVYNSMKIP
ncbi:MAG: methyltransferase domain-containing protein [Candidatus Thorarchaeota archaeon]